MIWRLVRNWHSIMRGKKKNAAAIAEYSRLVENHPADPIALNNLACIYQRQGALGIARELAQRAFKISPGDEALERTGFIQVGHIDPSQICPCLAVSEWRFACRKFLHFSSPLIMAGDDLPYFLLHNVAYGLNLLA